jgi:hypothetical protein
MHNEPWLSPVSTTTNTDDCLGISAMLEGMVSKISSYQAGCSTCPKYSYFRLLVAVPLKNHLCNPESIKAPPVYDTPTLNALGRPKLMYVVMKKRKGSTCPWRRLTALFERDLNGDDLKYNYNSTFITTSTR